MAKLTSLQVTFYLLSSFKLNHFRIDLMIHGRLSAISWNESKADLTFYTAEFRLTQFHLNSMAIK